MEITFVGLNNNNLQYKIKIDEFSFDYWTGLGWLSEKKENDSILMNPSSLSREEKLSVLKAVRPLKTITQYDLDTFYRVYRNKPKKSDIIECLYSDHDCGLMSFNDFCYDLGYSTDSFKAFEIYKKCMDTTEKIKKLEIKGLIKRPEEN